MSQSISKKQLYTGVTLAIIAAIIWSGNFIVARSVANKIPPVTLAFFRWATASLIMMPIAWKHVRKEFPAIKKNFRYLLWTAITGVAVFNTLVYIAAHTTSAINMALIGTTSSPVFVIAISALFFGERIKAIRIIGLLFCIAGIVVLISKGSLETLLNFHFGIGDIWVLAAALSFALYNIQVRRKPKEISSTNFLNIIFFLGSLVLLPFFLVESSYAPPIEWTNEFLFILLYLGLGTSVISFLLWNAAISKIGAVRTSLFGNLIPIFASIAAIVLLGEVLTWVHIFSGVLVIIGLTLANSRKANQPVAKPLDNND